VWIRLALPHCPPLDSEATYLCLQADFRDSCAHSHSDQPCVRRTRFKNERTFAFSRTAVVDDMTPNRRNHTRVDVRIYRKNQLNNRGTLRIDYRMQAVRHGQPLTSRCRPVRATEPPSCHTTATRGVESNCAIRLHMVQTVARSESERAKKARFPRSAAARSAQSTSIGGLVRRIGRMRASCWKSLRPALVHNRDGPAPSTTNRTRELEWCFDTECRPKESANFNDRRERETVKLALSPK
jgi:hypothetical protein